MKNKIAVIGAGGGFTLGLIHDLCITKTLYGTHICLMDIDEKRLNFTFEATTRQVKEAGADITISKTTDRKEALKDADFVVTTVLVDGVRRIKEGTAIVEKHGVKWADSFRVCFDENFWLDFYQMKLFEEITQDIIEICPDAYHLLVSNPVITAVTHLRRKYPQVKTVGMCHGFGEVYMIADAMGLDRKKLTFEAPGVNHFVWLTKVEYDGEDLYPKIKEWLETDEAKEYGIREFFGPFTPKKVDLLKRFGLLPLGDTAKVSGGSWPWYYHDSEETEEKWHSESRAWWIEYLTNVGLGKDRLENSLKITDKTIDEMYNLKPNELTGEPMVPFIEGLVADVGQVVVVNVLNDGEYVKGVPLDFQVEVPAYCDATGVHPLKTTDLPPAIRALILRERVSVIEMEIAAYESGDPELLKQLVLMDHWVNSEKQAEALIDEIMNLPYHTELKAHYNWK